MKICIICQNLQTLGGLQVVVAAVAQQLRAAEKAEITFLMPKLKEKPCFSLSDGFDMKELDDFVPVQNQKHKRIIRTLNRKTGCLDFSAAVPMMERMLFSKASIERLAKFVNAEKFDWVIGAAFNYSLLTAMIADKVDCRTAGWMHSTFQGYYEVRGTAYYGLKCLNRKYLPRLDCCFVLNQNDKKAFDQNYGMNTVVLHNPIRAKSAQQRKHKQGELLFVGRLNKQVKGLDYLAEIMKQLKRDSVEFHLTVVGSGPDEEWLKQEVQANGLSAYVTFTGFQENVTPYYEQASVLLSTSRWEGFGMTIVEAMSVGVPCVSFDNDGACEIVRNGKDGILIPRYEVDEFAQAVKKLLSDDSVWAQLSNAVMERAKDFEVSAIAEQMYKYLAEENRK